MKVLWFAGNPALYASRDSHNGGGWIAALQRELQAQKADEVQLGIAFPWENNFKQECGIITYYGVKSIKRSFWRYKLKEEKSLCQIKTIINDFKPEIIHVFGTEQIFGLAATCSSVPVVIHLQGILAACKEAWLPYSMSWFNFKFSNLKNFLMKLGLDRNVNREQRIFNACVNYMGRTEWDKNLVRIFNPNAIYYYCGEMLRPEIYYSNKIWEFSEKKQTKKIVSVISDPLYKGGDVILRAAKILKDQLKLPFVWHVYGVRDMKVWEKLVKLRHADVNVFPKGVIGATQLVDVILDADVFVHPSYIENSPNSVCEAQVLGAPVVACDVGGVSSIVKHGKTGMLIPSNDVFMMASMIKYLCDNKAFAEEIGRTARKDALARHSPRTIVNDLMNVYTSIVR